MPAVTRRPPHRAILRRWSQFRWRCRRGRWRRDLPCSRTSSSTTARATLSTPTAAGSFLSSHSGATATLPKENGLPACSLSPSRSADPAIRGRSERPTTSAVVLETHPRLPACPVGDRPRSPLGNMTSCSSSPAISSQLPIPFRCESRPGHYIGRQLAAHERKPGCGAHQAEPICRASSGARHPATSRRSRPRSSSAVRKARRCRTPTSAAASGFPRWPLSAWRASTFTTCGTPGISSSPTRAPTRRN